MRLPVSGLLMETTSSRDKPHLRKLIPEGPHDGGALSVCLPEQGVQVGQQGVALPQGVPVASRVVLAKEPGLPPLGF